MSTALAHFAVGAALTALLIVRLFPGIRYARLVVVFGGIWAVLPDAWRVAPVYQRQLEHVHHSPWADLFWFHYTMDQLDPHDSQLVGAVAISGLLAVLLFVEWRDFGRGSRSKKQGRVEDPSRGPGSDIYRRDSSGANGLFLHRLDTRCTPTE